MSFSRILFILVSFLIPMMPLAVQAATITVDDGAADAVAADGNCSLREAIQSANADAAPNANCTDGSGDDIIDLSGVSADILLGSALDDLLTNIIITGPGADALTIDAQNGDFSIFVISAINVNVGISGLTLTGASRSSGNGGAVQVTAQTASLTLDACHLTNNSLGGLQGGGALSNMGTTTILNSTFSNNHSDGQGGAVNNRSNGVMVIKNSTFSGNTADNNGGAIVQLAAGGSPSLTIVNSTITDNTADDDSSGSGTAGGLYNGVGGTATLSNTIVAANIDTGGQGPDCGGTTINSNGYNIMGDDSTCGFSATTGDLVGDSVSPVDPRLANLADNGGPTQTHGLLPNSPAIDAGNNTPVCSGADTDINDEDQRGETRCVDADGNGTTIDIGAYEVQVFTVDTAGDGNDDTNGDGVCATGGGACTLDAAVEEANALPGTDAILFSITGTNSIASNVNTITDSLMVTGPGSTNLTLSGPGINNLFEVNSGSNDQVLQVSGLTMTNWSRAFEINTGDSLILNSSVVTGNSGRGIRLYGGSGATGSIFESEISSNNAGGIFVGVTGTATFSMNRSLVANNFNANASGDGGGLSIGNSSTVNITNTTISGNRANRHGGGIDVVGDATLRIVNSTITGNRADADDGDDGDGGGVRAVGAGTTVTYKNTIMSNNQDYIGASVSPSNCNSASLNTTAGNNIEDGTDCGLNDASDQQSTDPLIGALADNGGPTQTHALQLGSPAIDAITGNCTDLSATAITQDQRGFSRPVDGDDNGSVNCDIGAFEVGTCGDGVVDAGEECDNAGSNSDTTADACRTTCVNPSCGDNVVDAGEACDDGNNTDGDGCQANCALPTCGDGIIDSGEACDDGTGNSDTTADACRTTCVAVSCGDGVLDNGEACDDGNADNTDSCLNTCVDAACGDGAVQAGVEECDDGNTDNGDGCSSLCESELSEGASNDLEGANPDLDFNSLIIGNTYNLNAPDPTGGSNLVPAQTLPESCTCDWSISEELLGAFNPTNACQTAIAILLQGPGQITLTVDCGNEGAGTYVQDITATGVTGTAGAGSSGGCSLIRK